jgi:hypothetical protein
VICPSRLGKYSQRRPGCRTPFSYVRYHSAEDSTLNASPPISENYFLRHRATIEYLPSLVGQISGQTCSTGMPAAGVEATFRLVDRVEQCPLFEPRLTSL